MITKTKEQLLDELLTGGNTAQRLAALEEKFCEYVARTDEKIRELEDKLYWHFQRTGR